MRKIITVQDREKKETRNKVIIGIVLVVLLVFSTAGYAFYRTGSDEIKKILYKDIEFVLQNDGLWHAEVQGNELKTVFNPEETENISGFLSISLLNYQNKPLYFSYDSDRQGVGEVVMNIGSHVGRVQHVCLDECEEDLPVKNCTENIIIIREGEETLIKQEDSCIYISGKGDIIRASDAFIFKLFKIN